MPKKTKKKLKVAESSDSDDDFKIPKRKGRKIALCDSDEGNDDNDFALSLKPSTSKGKIGSFGI